MSGSGRNARPVVEGLFDFDADAVRLLMSGCAACGADFFPRAPVCPYCGGSDVVDVTSTGTGATLWAWTAVNAAPPGYGGSVPYGFGVVELPGGVRIVTRITVADPAALSLGMPMRLTVDPVGSDEDGTEVVAWAFAPAAGVEGGA